MAFGNTTQYALWFVPEVGIDQPPYLICMPEGRSEAAFAMQGRAEDEWGRSDWLDPEAGYFEFVEQGRALINEFCQGESGFGLVVLVPYGSLVITG